MGDREIIHMEHMYKIYNQGLESEVRAVNDVSLVVREGEFVAVVGQSGSGKSTLMNLVGCLDTPTSGLYYLNGLDVSKLTDDEQATIRNEEIGFIFQSFNLIKTLSAYENVELPLIYRGVEPALRKQYVMAALTRVGLAARKDHKPAQMSGGQQQRVAVARAIAIKPPLILADEPTGNLDSAAGMEVLNIIQELHQQGHTILLITHDEKLAKQAPRVVRITDGRVESDRTQEQEAAMQGVI